MSVPNSNSTWQEQEIWMHYHQEELLEEYNQQQDKEREVFGEFTASYMMSSPLERYHEVLQDR